MQNKTDRLYVWGFVTVLGVLSLLFFVLPKQAFSEMENRSLQALPILSWERLWSNKFSKDAETFVTDHFPFRNEWVLGKSTLEQLRLQQENNGIYKGKDGYLFEMFEEPNYTELQKYAEAVKQFAERHPEADIKLLLAPNAIGIYPERLPWLAQAYPQTSVNEFIAEHIGNSLTFINGFDFLKPEAEDDANPIFYRTDHHWTTYGSYLAYVAYAEAMGWEAMTEEQFNIRTVTDSFLGSFHTRSQFSGLTADSVQIYEPKQPVSTELYIADTDTTVSSLYDASFLTKKDKYSYFQGGVHALMKLTSSLEPQVADQQKLLVVKDSYAHSVLPFLTQHAAEIHVIDIRFYNGSISSYMEENGIEDVLMLFNTSTFVTERNLLKLNY